MVKLKSTGKVLGEIVGQYQEQVLIKLITPTMINDVLVSVIAIYPWYLDNSDGIFNFGEFVEIANE